MTGNTTSRKEYRILAMTMMSSERLRILLECREQELYCKTEFEVFCPNFFSVLVFTVISGFSQCQLLF